MCAVVSSTTDMKCYLSCADSHCPNCVLIDRKNCRTRPARLVEGHLKLTLHSSLAGLGSLHAVLSKRRGKVITDEMVDGTDLIQVTATIPQVESFVSFDYYSSVLFLDHLVVRLLILLITIVPTPFFANRVWHLN